MFYVILTAKTGLIDIWKWRDIFKESEYCFVNINEVVNININIEKLVVNININIDRYMKMTWYF